jgi:hypothetical protein
LSLAQRSISDRLRLRLRHRALGTLRAEGSFRRTLRAGQERADGQELRRSRQLFTNFVADQLKRWKPLTALNRYLRMRASHLFAHLPNLWLGPAGAGAPTLSRDTNFRGATAASCLSRDPPCPFS